MLSYPEYTIREFLESKCDIAAKVVAIEALIDQALLTMADVIDTGGVVMYEVDDQQVRVKTMYRSVDEVMTGIAGLRKMQNIYLNRLNGRGVLLVNKQSLR